MLRLQGFNFTVVYRPGKTNIVDGLSRLNSVGSCDGGEKYDFVKTIVENSVPVSLSRREIAMMRNCDQVKNCVRSGNWERCTLSSYVPIKDKLCIYGEILLHGTRIVVSRILRDKFVRLAHEGHQGMLKTKYRLSNKVWWPGLDKDAEKVCHGCQVTSGYDPPEPMSRVLPPAVPRQGCSADLLGPLPSGVSILVVVDYFSRFLEVAILRSTTSAKIIEAISPMFPRFGLPFTLTTDNGPHFRVKGVRDIST